MLFLFPDPNMYPYQQVSTPQLTLAFCVMNSSVPSLIFHWCHYFMLGCIFFSILSWNPCNLDRNVAFFLFNESFILISLSSVSSSMRHQWVFLMFTGNKIFFVNSVGRSFQSLVSSFSVRFGQSNLSPKSLVVSIALSFLEYLSLIKLKKALITVKPTQSLFLYLLMSCHWIAYLL